MVIKTEKTASTAGNKTKPDETPAQTQAPSVRTAMATPGKLEPHPLSMIFPKLEGEALAELVEDIRRKGVQEAVTTLEEKILDGVNRDRAASKAGVIGYPIVEYKGDDPLGFVISKNLKRRHLDESQRAMVASKLATMRQGARTDLEPSANLPKVSQPAAAKMVKVSVKSVGHATTVRGKGVPELVAAVEAGEVAVSAAADVSQLPPTEQREAVAKGPKAITTAAKKAQLARPKSASKPPRHADQILAELYCLACDCLDTSAEKFLESLATPKKRQEAVTHMSVVSKWMTPILAAEPQQGQS